MVSLSAMSPGHPQDPPEHMLVFKTAGEGEGRGGRPSCRLNRKGILFWFVLFCKAIFKHNFRGFWVDEVCSFSFLVFFLLPLSFLLSCSSSWP